MIRNYPIKIVRRCYLGAGIILALAILTVLWFAFFPDRAFFGDDFDLIVGALSGGYASSFSDALTNAPAHKFRPVFAAFFHLTSSIFRTDIHSYFRLNMFLHLINACFVSYICYRLSRKQLLVALVSAVLFTVSRFSYYNLLQVYGSMEALALLLLLLLIGTTLRAYDSEEASPLGWPLVLFFLLILTHERYVVVCGFLTAAILLAPVSFRARWHRFALAATPFLIVLFNYLHKTLILHVRFFEGTGGEAISFNVVTFLTFMLTGFMNMLGFNVGPNYLSGLSIFRAGITGFALGGILAVLLVSLVLAYIYYQFGATRGIELSDVRDTFLFLVLFLLLLASASITFRQEYRWLYAPYVVVIMGVSYMSGRIPLMRWLRCLMILCILISGVSIDTFYRGYLRNVYFMGWLKIGATVKADIVDKYRPSLSEKDLFFICDSSDRESWAFMDSVFFEFYTGDPGIHMHYIEGLEDLRGYGVDIEELLVFSYDESKEEIVNLNEEAKDVLAKIIGADDVDTSAECGPEQMHMCRFTARRSGTVNEFRIKCTDIGNVKVAIYADSDGAPGSLLNAVNASTPVVGGWNSIVFPTTGLRIGNAYWLAFNSSARIVTFAEGSKPVIVLPYSPYDDYVFPLSMSGTYDTGLALISVSGY